MTDVLFFFDSGLVSCLLRLGFAFAEAIFTKASSTEAKLVCVINFLLFHPFIQSLYQLQPFSHLAFFIIYVFLSAISDVQHVIIYHLLCS